MEKKIHTGVRQRQGLHIGAHAIRTLEPGPSGPVPVAGFQEHRRRKIQGQDTGRAEASAQPWDRVAGPGAQIQYQLGFQADIVQSLQEPIGQLALEYRGLVVAGGGLVKGATRGAFVDGPPVQHRTSRRKAAIAPPVSWG